MEPLDQTLRRIAEVAPGLHTVGTFSRDVLEIIAHEASRREILHSAETGCGASTLLLSHLSRQHTVFALDGGNGSIVNVRRSPILRQESVTFVEGPTQLTLPGHSFTGKLQLALIDGPHAYPFPDLEYYYLYPHLESGGILIVDDIQIPTVHHLFEFLCKDAMFRLQQVARTTAFFTRTDAPVFDPLGDGWQQQGYNARTLWRYRWKQGLGKKDFRRARSFASVKIATPAARTHVAGTNMVEGSATLPQDSHLWILARRKDVQGWWPQGGGAAQVEQSSWKASVTLGTAEDTGREFEIAAAVVGPVTHEAWMDWIARVRQQPGPHAPVQLPPREFLVGIDYRTVIRGESK